MTGGASAVHLFGLRGAPQGPPAQVVQPAGPEVVAARLAGAGDHVRRMLTAPRGQRMHASLTDEIIAASKSR